MNSHLNLQYSNVDNTKSEKNELSLLMKNYFSKLFNEGFECLFKSFDDVCLQNNHVNLKTILTSLIYFNNNNSKNSDFSEYNHNPELEKIKLFWKKFLEEKMDNLSKELLKLSISFDNKIVYKKSNDNCEKAKIVLNLHGIDDLLIVSFDMEIVWQHEYYEVENIGDPQLETSIYFSEEIPKVFIR